MAKIVQDIMFKMRIHLKYFVAHFYGDLWWSIPPESGHAPTGFSPKH